MKATIKRITSITALILLIAAAAFVITSLTPDNAYAAQDLELEKTTVDFDADADPENGYVEIKVKDGCTEKVASAQSEDPYIVHAKPDYSYGQYVELYAQGLGDATVTVTGTEGTVITLHATVTDKALQAAMSYYMYAEHVFYGQKRFYVDNVAGATVTAKFGKDTYTATIPDDDYVYSTVYIDLDKFYDYKSKVVVIVEKDGATASRTYNIDTLTSVDAAKAKKKKLKVECYDLHKGDKVYLKIAGKTYTKKVTKNYHRKATWLTFSTKKNIKKNASFKVTVKNKYKKTLVVKKAKLKKYRYEEPDYDDDEE